MTQEAMKLALGALKGLKSMYGGNGHKLHEINMIHRKHDTAIIALEEALAQTQEPVAHWSDCAVHSEPAYPKGECDCGGYRPPKPSPATDEDMKIYKAIADNYTTSSPRKPLTENEIKHLWYEACQTNLELTSQLIVHLARNIEAAHGIKENT